jgi:ABC-type sugar transport system permease subunit
MDKTLIATAVWTLGSTLVGALVAVLLNRRAASRSRWSRTFVAIAFALLPTMLITMVALLSSGDPLSLILSMSLDRFIIPLALQLAIVLSVASPILWLISRRVRRERPETKVFE